MWMFICFTCYLFPFLVSFETTDVWLLITHLASQGKKEEVGGDFIPPLYNIYILDHPFIHLIQI
jgi:hypothetical protein